EGQETAAGFGGGCSGGGKDCPLSKRPLIDPGSKVRLDHRSSLPPPSAWLAESRSRHVPGGLGFLKRPACQSGQTASSFAENFSTTSSSFAYDREFLCTLPGLLIVAEIVLGLLVWTLIAGTEYFRVPAFGWVMFVAVFYWVLTVFFLIVYITMTYTRIPQVPWTTVGLCFNGSAFLLYLSAAVVDASSVSPEKDSHNFNSWAASSFFAFLVTICYAGNTYFSFIAWRSRTTQ
ncbi:CKLF-like MARVEL transmembrane domain-containing protein 8 isoform X1, partial [Cricetulus griseus]|uniref:CKLF-like MARVEL transmembrane domain-containing protein 8 isoform X1 n=1 Tax=Cricetulus griseus TaxID=10029 RepID=UPI000454A422